jgi:hypothetical protein
LTTAQLTALIESGKPRKSVKGGETGGDEEEATPAKQQQQRHGGGAGAAGNKSSNKKSRPTLLPGQLHAVFEQHEPVAEEDGGPASAAAQADAGADDPARAVDESSRGSFRQAAAPGAAPAKSAHDAVPEMPDAFVDQESAVVVPSYAAWFDTNGVSALEK